MKRKEDADVRRAFCIIWVCAFLFSFCVPAVSAEENDIIYTTKSDCYSETGKWYESPGLKGYTSEKSRYASGTDTCAKWNIEIEKGGYYRISFYNILHSSNMSTMAVRLTVSGDQKSMSFVHKGDNSQSRFAELGFYELLAGDCIEIALCPGSGSGFLRADSVKLEYFPYTQERVYQKDDFRQTAGTWNASALLGYKGSQSKYGLGSPCGRWIPDIGGEGIAEIYIYNLIDTGNCNEINVTYCDSDGVGHDFVFAHKGERSESKLVFLGRYDYAGTGKEYVEVSGPKYGYMRINALVVKMYSKNFIENKNTKYETRKLTEKTAEIFEPSKNAQMLYVKPGSTSGNGSREQPYATIKEAKEAVRRIKKQGYPDGGICVNLLSGTHVTETLTFTAEDSGTESAPVLWQAEDGAEVTTAATIAREDFEKVTGQEILNRIPCAARAKVYKAAVPGNLTGNMSISSPYVVSFDDTPGELAHWPNSGFERSGDLADIGTRSDGGVRSRGFVYRINNDHAFLWENEPNGYLGGYWMTPYTLDFTKIADIDTKNMTISGANGTGLGAYENARYRALNMLCELDSEGEWYIEDGIFYAYLPENCEKVYLSFKGNGIFRTDGASDIIFKNIAFKNCMGTAVAFSGNSARCAVIGGSIKNTSGYGAAIGGEECFVRDADISYTGGIGIVVTGGNEYILKHGGNYAENNTVTKTGRSMSIKTAISVAGCGNRISNNHIYDVPTQGITASGMENIIEKNIIERTNLEMGDTGGIYFLNYGMGYGSKIRYNIVKDSVGIAEQPGFSTEGALGIYLDDLTSGVEVTGNIIYNVREPALFGHGGRNLTFDNNVIINCDESIRVTKTAIKKNLDADTGVSAVNIRKYDNDIINGKYPEAVGALSDDFGEPKYNTVTNNVIYSADPPEVEDVKKNSGTVAGNVEYNNMPTSACTDFYDLDFSGIIADNPDFVPIDVSEIGTYCGGMRKNGEEIICDNRCEPFYITYPQNGEKDVPEDVTLKWENHGGVRKSMVYISEYPDMGFAKRYETSENSLELSLESGKTYYWRVANEPFLDYTSRMNEGETFSFSTVGCRERCEMLGKSMEFLAYGFDESEFAREDAETLRGQIAEFESMTDYAAAAEFARGAIDAFLGKRKKQGDTDTVIFDDYSADTVGEKPFGLFQRSTGNLDIKAAYLPGEENIGVKFNDDGEFCHYATRYFYPEKDFVGFATRVVPEASGGVFSMSIVKAGCHSTRDGVSAGNAARVIFDSDGVIYGDMAKKYPLMEYLPQQSYDVKIALDVKNKLYDVYVNGELKASGIAVSCNDLEEAGAILFDTSDGTQKSFAKSGVFYIDDTVVQTPRKYGKNASLTELLIDGEKVAAEHEVLDEGIGEESQIEFAVAQNAKARIVREGKKAYITVVSGDLDKVKTYIIK